ncbi:MAG: glycogen synthase GlgA [Acetobacteraceae bacterium]
MRVLAVTPEVFPLIKTGGLADVAGALPLALVAHGVRTTTLVPGYASVLAALSDAEPVHAVEDLFGGPARVLRGSAAGLDILAIEAPHLYARPGNPYVGPDGRDWPDNAQRFAALGLIASDLVPVLSPDIVHAHDWQAGLTPAYLRYRSERPPGTVITVHNLAFQGQFPAHLLGVLHLPPQSWSIEGVEYYGSIGFLKAGLALADRITTVSPTYAEEIRTQDGGMGLDGLLRNRADVLHGIRNGIDDTIWDPATDPMIPAPFSATRWKRRAANKAALQVRLGLDAAPEALVFGVISRLTWQKGLDLVLADLAALLDRNAQLALLGSGDAALQEGFAAAASAHPGRIGCVIGYDEALAHLIQAGADALLVPSRFEPCGLTQLCALRYGAVPVVSRVGGLADTVIDASEAALAAGVATGVQFAPTTPAGLRSALRRTEALWRDQTAWRRMQRNAMQADVSWRRPASQYAALYRDLMAQHAR